MIVLMNYAVPIIIITSILIAWKLKQKWVLVIGFALAAIWTITQPTVLPKGTVAQPVIQQLDVVDKPIVDRSLKPMSDAERDKRRNDELNAINERIEKSISKESVK